MIKRFGSNGWMLLAQGCGMMRIVLLFELIYYNYTIMTAVAVRFGLD